jgi:hypothetical protein
MIQLTETLKMLWGSKSMGIWLANIGFPAMRILQKEDPFIQGGTLFSIMTAFPPILRTRLISLRDFLIFVEPPSPVKEYTLSK